MLKDYDLFLIWPGFPRKIRNPPWREVYADFPQLTGSISTASSLPFR